MPNYFGNFPQNFMQQQFVQPQVNNPILVVPVKSESSANAYPVAAGNTVFLFNFDTNTFWIKATDVNGILSRFEVYEFKNKVAPATAQENNFVNQSEFSELKNQLQALTASLNGLISKGDNTNAKLNEQPANVSAEVQRICEQLTEQREKSPTTGTATA